MHSFKEIFNMNRPISFTIEDKKKLLSFQYMIESLIEDYYLLQTESQKYKLKFYFLQFIESEQLPIKEVVDYMSLQEDKFKPFITLLSNVKQTKRRKKRVTSECSKEVKDILDSQKSIVMLEF